MPKSWQKGIIGALAGGIEGYSAGKLNEAATLTKSNDMLIEDIMKRNMEQFRQKFEMKLAETEHGYRKSEYGVQSENRINELKEGHKLDLARDESTQAFEFKKLEKQFGYDKALKMMEASSSSGAGGGSRSKYINLVNPQTGQAMQIVEGSQIPEGFVFEGYAKDINSPRNAKELEYENEIKVRDALGSIGYRTNDMGTLTGPTLTEEQATQAKARSAAIGVKLHTVPEGGGHVVIDAVPMLGGGRGKDPDLEAAKARAAAAKGTKGSDEKPPVKERLPIEPEAKAKTGGQDKPRVLGKSWNKWREGMDKDDLVEAATLGWKKKQK